MSQCPEMVDTFFQRLKHTTYDIVHSFVAWNLKDTNQDVDHGKMTTIIRYKTPYVVNSKDLFIISYALGNDISLRCIFGLSTFFLSMKGTNISVYNELLCT